MNATATATALPDAKELVEGLTGEVLRYSMNLTLTLADASEETRRSLAVILAAALRDRDASVPASISRMAGEPGDDPWASILPDRCPACGDFIDYCQGHGEIGDPVGRSILDAHDEGDHSRCDPRGCLDLLAD